MELKEQGSGPPTGHTILWKPNLDHWRRLNMYKVSHVQSIQKYNKKNIFNLDSPKWNGKVLLECHTKLNSSVTETPPVLSSERD